MLQTKNRDIKCGINLKEKNFLDFHAAYFSKKN